VIIVFRRPEHFGSSDDSSDADSRRKKVAVNKNVPKVPAIYRNTVAEAPVSTGTIADASASQQATSEDTDSVSEPLVQSADDLTNSGSSRPEQSTSAGDQGTNLMSTPTDGRQKSYSSKQLDNSCGC